ncbi:unnamed protein product [Owenia fusiformis]|uniref:Uncharacterized protein n=1 Tax=Owenia fusiformis TaxID=6347 RepID=A0A8S4Q3R9_OWEFU|nr:unnamed protein product [Owenia fusiformis]
MPGKGDRTDDGSDIGKRNEQISDTGSPLLEEHEKKTNTVTRRTLYVAVILACTVTAVLMGIVFITASLTRGSQCPHFIEKSNNGCGYPESPQSTLRECLRATNLSTIDKIEIFGTNNIDVNNCLVKNNMADNTGTNATNTTSFLLTDDTCPSGDYLLVRRNDQVNGSDLIRPSCERMVIGILTEQLFYSREHCFNLACKSNANVVYYDPKVECAAYKCESDLNGLDWAYTWTIAATSSGRTYARPHSYAKPCHNSHFMNRTVANVRATCFTISNTIVESLAECMDKACMDKGNTFNFIVNGSYRGMECETQHCGWDITANDYVFDLRQNEDGHSVVYSLSHKIKSCKNLLKTQPVEFPVLLLGQCGHPGYFNAELLESTNQEIPNDFCESGSNTFIHINGDNKYLAYKCNSNHEGTYWKFYDNKCYGDGVFAKWWIVPHPGTPNCKSDMFTLRRMAPSCQKSNCNPSRFEKVSTARDLRQCMLHACEKGYNVINYFSNATVVLCELRNCHRYKDGDYDFRYEATDGTHGYDVYALQPYASICKGHASKSLYAKDTTSYFVTLDKK